jgi:hypothetical protein
MSDLMFGSIFGAGMGLLGGLSMLLVQRLFPPPLPVAVERPMAELRRDYNSWEIKLKFIFLGTAAASGLIIFEILSFVAAFLPSMHPSASIVLTPAGPILGMPALFSAIGVGQFPAWVILRSILKERYPEFLRYHALRDRISPRAADMFLVAYLVLCGAVAVLIMSSNVRFTEDKLIVRPILSLLETTHRYSDIESIRTAARSIGPNGKVFKGREYAIRFKDGSSWNTHLNAADASPEKKRDVANFVSAHAGVPLTEVDILTNEETSP